jgi:DNA-directed RNA polymerase subunit beta'
MAFDHGEISLQSQVKIRLSDIVPPLGEDAGDWEEGQSVILETTLGRSLFNDTLPADYPYVNYEVGKKALGAIVNDLAERYTSGRCVAHDALKDTGAPATRCGVTVPRGCRHPGQQGRDPQWYETQLPTSRSSSSAA